MAVNPEPLFDSRWWRRLLAWWDRRVADSMEQAWWGPLDDEEHR